MQAVSILWSAA